MVRYHNFDVVFAEIPDETTLAINITGCPNRCPGCHSPHLQRDEGRPLDDAELRALLGRYGESVTCVCFMGGDASPHEIARLARLVRQERTALRTAWFERLGPLTTPTTNQRLYRRSEDGTLHDITERFRRRT